MWYALQSEIRVVVTRIAGNLLPDKWRQLHNSRLGRDFDLGNYKPGQRSMEFIDLPGQAAIFHQMTGLGYGITCRKTGEHLAGIGRWHGILPLVTHSSVIGTFDGDVSAIAP